MSAFEGFELNLRSVRAIAKKDFQDAVRSWVFWGLSVFFFTLLVVVTGVIAWFGEDIVTAGATTEVLVALVSEITRLVIPLIALVLGWKSIAGERERGSIKVLLSLPHSRLDVVLGKFIGRAVVLSLSLVIGFALAAVVVATLLGSFDLTDYLGLLAMSVLYALAYTSIALSLSSLTDSTTIAGAAMFGVFVLFYIVWDAISTTVRLLMRFDYIDGVAYTTTLNGQTIEGMRRPDWAFFIEMLDPGTAYANVLTLVTSAAEIEGATQLREALFQGAIPFYLQDWFSFIVLLFWISLPLAVAIWRFQQIDL